MKTALGIDFGTSNSALATCGPDGQVKLLSAKANGSSTVPTVLFFPHYAREVHVGHEAVGAYLESGFEGRFVQSIKAYLPSQTFTGTRIQNRFFSLEDLISSFVTRLLKAAEAEHGLKPDGPVVVGRPARFSADPEAEKLATDRLTRAIAQAGLSDARFVIEPVAAALAYESSLETDETVFVADLGGGTSDFAVMRVGPSYRAQADRADSILSSGGLSVAGDRFDGEVVRATVFPLLGWGTEYNTMTGPARVPNWMYLRLLQWNHVSFLKSAKNIAFLRKVAETSRAKEALSAFVRIVDEDLGYILYRAVEMAKREASQGRSARIRDEENGLPVDTELTPEIFAEATHGLIEEIRGHALGVLADAQLKPNDIDAVFITGGTGLLPVVRATFETLFGADRVRSRHAFTSVADGLARSAWSELQ